MDVTRYKRLRWLCRRGMKELDLCLNSYLEQYPQLNEAQLQALESLLQWQDDRLWDGVRGALQLEDPQQQALLMALSSLARQLNDDTQ